MVLNKPPKGTLDYHTFLNENFQKIMDFIACLAKVATSGSYKDLSDKPMIPAEYNHPETHPASMITGLNKVAASGSYDDLSDKPIIVIPATFVIGTETSGHTLNDVDYLCTGTDDQKIINAAIAALPASGGKIVIREGIYNIVSRINVSKDNVIICGMGNSTVLKRMFDSTSSILGVIYVTSSYNKIQDLQIDGNKALYTSEYNSGIYLSGNNNTVTRNVCNGNCYGIYLYAGNNNTITGNTCNNNANYGIYLSSNNKNNIITRNTCSYNSWGIYLINSSSNRSNAITGNTCNNNNNYGICLSDCSNNAITVNMCNDNGSGIYLSGSNNTITGNTCDNNSGRGINLNNGNNNTITGNTCNNNDDTGINLNNSNNNTITGNTCIRGDGDSSDYTISHFTIVLLGNNNNYNLIANNNIMGKNYVFGGGSSNTFINNKYE